ncbi:MAG: HAMP domain-containing histidine kinase [Verrucomicrobia bacterium]|nr:HAMP domain-containing histidine kinase [Verrucomicrobiota bacterium]MBI3870711.1 HAMP domain-containing histidine kinase [Verrucomicrobiota bacterium]
MRAPRFRSSLSIHLARGIALVVLLSFLALAGFAALSHIRDREAVTQRAEREARVLAPRLATLAQQDFQRFLQEYADRNAAAWPPANAMALPAPTTNGSTDWKSLFLPTPPLALTLDGAWESPAPLIDIPSSPVWVSLLSARQQQQLAIAERWNGRADTADGVVAWKRFAEIGPPDAAPLAGYGAILCGPRSEFQIAVASFLRAVPSAAQTESGLPLLAVAAMEFLRESKTTPEEEVPLLRALRCAIVECPSFLTSKLLEAMERSPTRFSNERRGEIAALRAIWNRSQWVRELAARCPRQELTRVPPEPFWLGGGQTNEPALLLPIPRKADRAGSTMWLPMDRSTLARHTQSSLASLQALLPDYAGLELRLGDFPLGHSPGAWPTDASPVLLGSERAPGLPPSSRMALSVSILLAQPAQLYAQHDRRARFTALYLGSMTATALIGLGVLWRVFQRQRALAEAQSNFVSSVSHELRAPVAAISLLSENLTKDDFSDASRRREYYQLILQECRRLASLVENALDFSRLERAAQTFEPEPTDTARLVAQVCGAMSPRASESRVRLTVIAPQGPVEWTLDGRAVERALTNLIDNALKHSPANAEVVVELRRDPDALRLSVVDQGPGIPASERQRIFEPFYRRGSELRRETRGVGIGLTLVHHIMEAHGGAVRVQSEVGAGSCFTLEFPCGSPSPPAGSNETQPAR